MFCGEKPRKYTTGLLLFAACAALGDASASLGQSTWIGANNGNWSVDANWNPTGVPTGSSTNVTVAPGYLVTGTINFDYAYTNPTGIGDLLVNSVTAHDLTLSQTADGSSLVAATETIGSAGRATWSESSGTNSVGSNLWVGYGDGSTGNYLLSGGTLTAGTQEDIGFFGASVRALGTFVQSGGSNTTPRLVLGDNTGATGTYTLSSGQLLVTDLEDIGNLGNGQFTQTGGTHIISGAGNAATLIIGDVTNEAGSYTLSGTGTLSVNGSETIGLDHGGKGSFTQHGGTHTVGSNGTPQNLTIGQMAASQGSYTLDATSSASSLEVWGNEAIAASGSSGSVAGASGTFSQNGGTHTIHGTFTIGAGTGSIGSYSMSGAATVLQGLLSETINTGINSFTQSNGTNITPSLTIGASGGHYTLQGGTLSVTNTFTDNGAFSQTAGTATISKILGAGSITVGGTGVLTIPTGATAHQIGSLTINSGGKVNLSLAASKFTRTILVTSGLTFAGTTNAWQGKLDLSNNDMIVKGGDIAAVTNQLKMGFNAASGYWNGSAGIVSTKTAADPNHLTTLGAIVNNDGSGHAIYGSTTAYGLFYGQNPGSNDVLVKYTYYGDADLNGHIDGTDYAKIDNGFAHGLTGWFNGDFNYDGVVDGSDYSLIDNAFNMQGTPLEGGSLAAPADSQAAAWISVSSVPEPSTFALLLPAAAMLHRRSRRPRAITPPPRL